MPPGASERHASSACPAPGGLLTAAALLFAAILAGVLLWLLTDLVFALAVAVGFAAISALGLFPYWGQWQLWACIAADEGSRRQRKQ